MKRLLVLLSSFLVPLCAFAAGIGPETDFTKYLKLAPDAPTWRTRLAIDGGTIITNGGTNVFLTYARSVSTIADLVVLPIDAGSTNTVVNVRGYHAEADGGGGLYYWQFGDYSDTNYGSVLATLDTSFTDLGRWDALMDNVNVRRFGARGDGLNDDTARVRNALSVAESTQTPLYFPSGTYLMASMTNSATAKLQVFGDGLTSILKHADGSDPTMWYVPSGATLDFSSFAVLGNHGTSTRWILPGGSAYIRDIASLGGWSGSFSSQDDAWFSRISSTNTLTIGNDSTIYWNDSVIRIGYLAQSQSTLPEGGVSVGDYALTSSTGTNDYSISIGYEAARDNSGDISHSIAIGTDAGISNTGSATNALALGWASVFTADNTYDFGNASVQTHVFHGGTNIALKLERDDANYINFGVVNAYTLISSSEPIKVSPLGAANGALFIGDYIYGYNTLSLGGNASAGGMLDAHLVGSVYNHAVTANIGTTNDVRSRLYMPDTNTITLTAESGGGGNTNVNINLVPTGTGTIQVKGNNGYTGTNVWAATGTNWTLKIINGIVTDLAHSP